MSDGLSGTGKDEIIFPENIPVVEDGLHKRWSKKETTLLGLGIVVCAIVIAYAVVNGDTELFDTTHDIGSDPVLNLEDIPEEELLRLIIADQRPYAYHWTDHDWTSAHLDHEEPSLLQIQETLYWARHNAGEQFLKEIETNIIDGAKLNEGRLSNGENTMLSIISFTLHTQYCYDNPTFPNCKFFMANYLEYSYQLGEIDRDQYYVSLKPFMNQEEINDVEGLDES